MPLARGDARFIRLPVFSRKFLLTRTMFSGLHLSLSLTVVNVSFSQSFQRSVAYRLFRCFPKASAKLLLILKPAKLLRIIFSQNFHIFTQIADS